MLAREDRLEAEAGRLEAEAQRLETEAQRLADRAAELTAELETLDHPAPAGRGSSRSSGAASSSGSPA